MCTPLSAAPLEHEPVSRKWFIHSITGKQRHSMTTEASCFYVMVG